MINDINFTDIKGTHFCENHLYSTKKGKTAMVIKPENMYQMACNLSVVLFGSLTGTGDIRGLPVVLLLCDGLGINRR